MIVVTGGAGFIGSVLIGMLNKRGIVDVLVVDDVDHPRKAGNLEPLEVSGIIGIDAFLERIRTDKDFPRSVDAVFHLGACSSTREMNWDYLLARNVNYTKELMEWCSMHGIRFIYASSAATYGNGSNGYSDSPELFDALEPLNPYGKSKLAVDIWARDTGHLDHAVGLRYFNVFGPNEYHKEDMSSLVAKKYDHIAREGYLELFRSYHPQYGDGEQKRDFIYVLDAVEMTLFFLDTPDVHGIFNIGSGTTTTWNELAKAMGNAVGKDTDIRYVDMPEDMQPHYQYFTQADMRSLERAGWRGSLTSLNDAVREYIQEYLLPGRHFNQRD